MEIQIQHQRPERGTTVAAFANLVDISLQSCDALAVVLRAKSVPEAREEIALAGFTRAELAQLLFFVVAICHQTSVVGHPPLEGTIDGVRFRGWDYLLQRFVKTAREDKTRLSPSFWSTITADELRRWFRNSEGQDRLLHLERRAELLQDAGRTMIQQGWDTLDDLFRACDGRIGLGSLNLLNELSRFSAYLDPVRKKSFLFLALMRNTGTWTYKDPENLGAPVDYHEVRGHLRIGTIVVKDPRLRHKLSSRQPVTDREDIAIRSAVSAAIGRLSETAGVSDPECLHYMFWNIFRTYCTRDNPNCFGSRSEDYLPERYVALTTADQEGKRPCPFSEACASAGAKMLYMEHVHDTDFY